MMAIRRPVERAAARRFSITCVWPSRSPCAKLSRATFIPALISLSMTARDSDAGPMVATIFVFWSASFTMGFSFFNIHTTLSRKITSMITESRLKCPAVREDD